VPSPPKTQPDACIILFALKPSPMMDQEACDMIRKLLAKGVLGGGVLETDDCRRTYEELKAKGVEFIREPWECLTASRPCSATTRATFTAWASERADAYGGRAQRKPSP
jgi:hypothetical protein